MAASEGEGMGYWAVLFALQDAGEDPLCSLMDRPVRVGGDAFSLSYTVVYSSFMHHVRNASDRRSVNVRSVPVELGRRHRVGRQEDMIVDVAMDWAGTKT